ncbi:MAG TPA: electron transfer flavoprotein subunit alpha/FixB family protein [Saprospiraceae bacterium]|nr:electron transfer flavoprotein subunit alpha/FixB family protein [Saprospiraceae bacterium]HMQ82496.1 electron transfer flavoprotein subunit alpha/FixB family protein [Saprospiraceae bacterium]
MVLVFAETQNGKIKKAALEAVSYGHQTAQVLGSSCTALVLGEAEGMAELGKYGASKVYQVNNPQLRDFDSQVYAGVIANAAQQLGASVVIVNHSANGKSLLGRLSVRLQAGAVSGVNTVPTTTNGFRVRKSVFSGKATAEYEIKTAIKVLSLMGNAVQAVQVGEAVEAVALDVAVPTGRTKVLEVKRIEGKTPLPEADKVVSAGRGMKGPENWGIIEELAEVVGAATACSRPVADVHWRPHHEHVGQTGIAVRPNLYIAIGISGAIQHLAGVNNSKTIVVINKDPEAPFFKAADYGVVGDLFEVVPRLTEAFKKHRAAEG